MSKALIPGTNGNKNSIDPQAASLLHENRLEKYVLEEDGPSVDVAGLGESLKLTKKEPVEFTREFAQDLLDMPQFIGERPTRETWVKHLASQMEGGTFRWEWVRVIVCRCKEPHRGIDPFGEEKDYPAGTMFRINGRHTSWARLLLPEKMRAPVEFIRYTAATVQDMRQLYATCDRGAPRTVQNVVNSYVAGREEFSGIRKGIMGRVAPALSYWLTKGNRTRNAHTPDEIACLMLTDYLPLVQKTCRFLMELGGEPRHVLKSQIFGAMLATFNAKPLIAPKFWQVVITGIGAESATDPRHKLRDLLLTKKIVKDGGGVGSSDLSAEEAYRVSLHAWNCWRTGRKIKSLRPPRGSDRPEIM